MTKYEEFRFSDMCQVFSFSLGLSGHLLLRLVGDWELQLEQISRPRKKFIKLK